ncbi:hypothetical protein IFO70_33365 [Phormidium tenue FACHB-886]|nr:hypothetical protein [Phormidium tenue FACHB-886]
MKTSKYELMSAEETAKILGITLNRLYRICDVFDQRDDDQWNLAEGEHFDWLSKNQKTRRFYEEGAMAIAKYIQESANANPVSGFLDGVLEKITNRRKHTRQLLVRRRVILELQDLEGVVIKNNLVFIERPRIIRILATNGKGLNAAARRENNNGDLQGRETMQIGVHFDTLNNAEYWSQRGLARIAQNMSENLSQKSRRAWTEAVAEVVEDAIEQQQKYLESFDARVKRAMDRVKSDAKQKCQVTKVRQAPASPFDMHVHHLFDRSTRPDLAAFRGNLIAIHEDLHREFHQWHGHSSCEPKHFIEYLTTVEAWRFESASMTSHLHSLINRLENLQHDFESHYCLVQD